MPHDQANSSSGLHRAVCCLVRIVVARAGRDLQAGAGERCLHAHPADSALEHCSDLSRFQSASDCFSDEPSRRCCSIDCGHGDGLLCEVGDGRCARPQPAIGQHVGTCDLVDCQRPVVFWRTHVSIASVSSLFAFLDCSHSRLCFEPDRRLPATAVRLRLTTHVPPGGRAGDAGWHIVVSIPGLDIEVAQECSSIRSSLMLVVTTMVLAHLFLRSWWRKVLLIAVAIPLSVAKNGFRIFTIGELGTRVDPSFLSGRLIIRVASSSWPLGDCHGVIPLDVAENRNPISQERLRADFSSCNSSHRLRRIMLLENL